MILVIGKRSILQLPRVVAQMVRHESLNEIIAVIVAGLHAQIQRLPGFGRGSGEFFRLELLDQELVPRTLIDEDGSGERLGYHEFAGIVVVPAAGILSQVIGERLFAPRALHRRRNRRERGNRFIAVRIAQRAHQGAVAAHRVTENSARLRSRRKIGADKLRPLPRHIAVHSIVLRQRGLRGVDIKAGRIAEVPAVGIAGQPRLARAGVRRDQHQPQFRRDLLRMRLDGKGFLGAGEAGQIVEYGHRPGARLRRQEGGEFHRPADLAGGVLVEALRGAEAAVLRNQAQRAHEYTTTLRIDSPECIRSNALLMSASGIRCVMRSSMLILPFMYQSTIFGTSVRPRAPPKAVPFQTRPVTSWNGRVLVFLSAPATPTTPATPRPRLQHSSAWRMRSTLPTHSKL